MQAEQIEIASAAEKGKIGIMYLKRFWSIKKGIRSSATNEHKYDEWRLDTLLFTALGIGITHIIMKYNEAKKLNAIYGIIIKQFFI